MNPRDSSKSTLRSDGWQSRESLFRRNIGDLIVSHDDLMINRATAFASFLLLGFLEIGQEM